MRSEGARVKPKPRVRASPPNSATETQQMCPEWFKMRRYRHLDLPVGSEFIEKTKNPLYVASHSFLPLLNYTKTDRKYKKDQHDVINKDRPISYASHKDACILSYYAHKLNKYLDKIYLDNNLDKNVIAYRSLGKANYDFASEVFDFCKQNAPVVVLAFDIEKFFDTLDHKLLKDRFKKILCTDKLQEDWYKIFKYVTNFHYISIDEMKNDKLFSLRFSDKKIPV